MVLDEGATSSIFQDYHHCELAVIDTRPKDADLTTAFSGDALSVGATLQKASLPFKIEILALYKNTAILQKTTAIQAHEKGMALRFEIKDRPLDKDEHNNRAGTRIRISGLDSQQDGEYLLLEDMGVPQTLQVDGHIFYITLRKIHHQLPFSIELIDFEKQVHPGTGMARSYQSVVNIIEGGAKRKVTISMNKPLRSHDYTLYQASFSQVDGRETSVLTVVKNAGRVFPYISSIIICIGILIHLVIQIPNLMKRG